MPFLFSRIDLFHVSGKPFINMIKELWWLISRVDLTRLSDAQMAGKMLFLVVSERVSLEDISVWISRLNKGGPHQCRWPPSNPLRAWSEQKGRGRAFSLSLCFFFCFCSHTVTFLVLGLPDSNQDLRHLPQNSQVLVLRPNCTTELPGFPDSRWQMVGLLGLHNHMSQFL